MSTEKSLALVLRVTAFSETSCVGLLFTREFGNLSLVAKGARRPKSPFEAALDVLAVCRIVFLHKSSAMGILTEAKLERRFRNRRQELDWLYAAYYVVELLKALLEEGDPHPELFDLANQTIEELDRTSDTTCRSIGSSLNDSDLPAMTKKYELNSILLRFEVGLLKYLGHFPLLTHCVGCGRERTQDSNVIFGLQAGGVLCPRCQSTATNRIRVSAGSIKSLNELSQEFDGREMGREGNVEMVEPRELGNQQSVTSKIKEPHSGYTCNKVPGYRVRPADSIPETELAESSLNADSFGEIRTLMNQYLAVLLGHEPKAMRFLSGLT